MSQKDVAVAEIDERLRPPSEEQVGEALMRFAAEVRRHYGDRVKGIYLFGSRARGDHTPESDADVAVVLDKGDWIDWIERRTLNALAYDTRLDSGLAIQSWPFSMDQWGDRGSGAEKFVVAARRTARPIGSKWDVIPDAAEGGDPGSMYPCATFRPKCRGTWIPALPRLVAGVGRDDSRSCQVARTWEARR